ATGFQRAADFYFNKTLDRLNFTESLILACLPSAPERFSPIRNVPSLAAKMDIVYHEMREENFNAPVPEEYARQKEEVLRSFALRAVAESVFGERLNEAPWVAELARAFIKNTLGEEFVYDSGLTIVSTID